MIHSVAYNQFWIQRISFSPPRKLGRKSWHHLHSEIINISDQFKLIKWFPPVLFLIHNTLVTQRSTKLTLFTYRNLSRCARDYWLKFLTMCSLVLWVFAMHFGGPVRVGPVQRAETMVRRLISRRAAAEWPCEAVTALQMMMRPPLTLPRALSRSPLPAALFGRLRICHSQRYASWHVTFVFGNRSLHSNAPSHSQNTGQQTVAKSCNQHAVFLSWCSRRCGERENTTLFMQCASVILGLKKLSK